MNATEIRTVVLKVLGEIAPEAVHLAIDEAAPLREQLDLDSMDFLNFMIGLHDKLHVDIPETDYPKVQTLDDLIAYLSSRLGETKVPPSALV
jgi:acyl carrier protein